MPAFLTKTLPVLALLCSSTTVAFAQVAVHPATAGTLLQYDFNDVVTWPVLENPKPGDTGVISGKYGTVDVTDTAEPSGGLRLTVANGARDGWSEAIRSGLLAVRNGDTHLGKLTLAFSLAASRALPVKVIVESFDAAQKRTGGIETLIYPAAADFYQRHALELSTMRPTGEGVFDPTAPFLQLTFALDHASGWPALTRHHLRLDNVHYARPAYYVAPAGDDTRDGRTEAMAFATAQRAMDAAQPGDIVVLMDGTYSRSESQPEKTPVARFVRGGTPAGWITLKNYPGHTPVLSAHGQQAVNLTVDRWGTPDEARQMGYLEVRGLHIRGNGDTAREQYSDELGKFSPNTHSVGIMVNGRKASHPAPRRPGEIIHHIRVADNRVEFCTADGIYAEYADWLFIERNVIKDNCWTTPGYAPAGLAVMGFANFDTQDDIAKMLIAGNLVSGNRLYVMNQPYGKTPKTGYFNGNGILLDANAETPPAVYLGRTLVQNNVVFNNGGGGIQMWANHRMDVVNNTVYFNGATPELKWGQIGFERCRDVRLINNIVVAQPDRPLDAWMVGRLDRGTDRILRLNNLYWGGAHPPIEGINDLVADPLFVNPTLDPATADFRLQPGSPAWKAGRWEPFAPSTDADGKPRPHRTAPDLGALQR